MAREIRLEIRTIHDAHGNIYDIFDIQRNTKTIVGMVWRSICVYDTLEEAMKWHPDIKITDNRRDS